MFRTLRKNILETFLITKNPLKVTEKCLSYLSEVVVCGCFGGHLKATQLLFSTADHIEIFYALLGI